MVYKKMTTEKYAQSMKELKRLIMDWNKNHKGIISIEDVIAWGKLYYLKGVKDTNEINKYIKDNTLVKQ